MTASSTVSTLVFIDARVEGAQALQDALPAGTACCLLDPDRDGLAQMQQALAGRSGLAAIHVVSHGAPGLLLLGSTTLDLGSLASRTADLQAVGTALVDGGDLLLYGCNVAQGAEGLAFIDALA